MPNVILMRVEFGGQKLIIGGYTSHGWLREDMITENVGGMNLTMRFGGDDTCFLFNLTQNLRFDTLKHSDLADQGVEIPVYAATTMAYDEDMSNPSDENEDEDQDDENESNEEESVTD